jgi:hypothetical protein
MVLMIESQLNYLMGCLTMRARRASRVEVRADAVAEFNDEIDRSMKGTVWSSCGCSSWYLDSTGRNTPCGRVGRSPSAAAPAISSRRST